MKKILFLFFLLNLASCAVPQKEFYPASFTEQRKTWTWMIYMNADNSLTGNDLVNIRQMMTADPEQPINIIVLWDSASNGDSRLVKVSYNQLTNLTATINGVSFPGTNPEVNMTDISTLSDFVAYAKAAFPADYYALTLWSHSDGWRSASRGLELDETDGGGVLTNAQIAQALSFPGNRVQIVIFDSCLQGSLESLWALKKQDAADYVVASPHLVPASGWNYYDFLNRFTSSYRRPDDFLTNAVDSYENTYSSTSSWTEISLAAYDLSALNIASGNGTLTDLFSWVYNSGSVRSGEQTFMDSTEKFCTVYGSAASYYQRNLYDYLSRTAYPYRASISNALQSLVRYSWIKGKAKGYPALALAQIFGTWSTEYDSIPLASDTNWNELANLWK